MSFQNYTWSQLEPHFISSFINGNQNNLNGIIASPAFRALSISDIATVYRNTLMTLINNYTQGSDLLYLNKIRKLVDLGLSLNGPEYINGTVLNNVMSLNNPDHQLLALLISLGAKPEYVSDRVRFNRAMSKNK